jgi:hypothetical protein
MNLAPYAGGQRLIRASALAGVAGLLLTLALGFLDPRRVLFSYVVAFVFWVGIAVSAIILLGTFHASNAKWPVVLRRFVETMPLSIPVLLALLVPILLGMRLLFPWMDVAGLDPGLQETMRWRAPYLNRSFFVVRGIFYFAFWWITAHLLRAWSVKQDAVGGVALTVWQRRLGSASLPFLAITMSFAAIDWMMSLDLRFFSTIFGVYWFAGSFTAVFAVIAIVGAASRGDPTMFGHHMSVEHFHSVGKFMLAFVAFWAYMAFSQFMLIWIANIPEEVPWYVVRIHGGWTPVFWFLVLLKFVVPFFLLLSRDLKRSPVALAWMGAWLLLTQWVDVYWLVMPALSPEGPRPHLADLTALVGIGGVAVAYTTWRLRGAATVPLQDPYLTESLRYIPR